jgi:hypothetical protein
MFCTYHLPELCTYLIATLASLDVKNLTHFEETETKNQEQKKEKEKREFENAEGRGGFL